MELRSHVILSRALNELHALVNSLHAIQIKLDAIAEHTEPKDENNKPEEQLPPVLNAELKLPPSITSYYDAKALPKNWEPPHWRSAYR